MNCLFNFDILRWAYGLLLSFILNTHKTASTLFVTDFYRHHTEKVHNQVDPHSSIWNNKRLIHRASFVMHEQSCIWIL